MRVLDNLEPKKVFYYFEELCKIPHGSKNTRQVSEWLELFAQKRKLECIRDEFDNVIIIKEASCGYEKSEPVILQGHIDMVCEKAPGCEKDMDKEGLDLALDGDFVFAHKTTLGGDDGIAVAMMLAILDSDELSHPRIEAVFTADEEIGLLGATAIDLSMLKGKRLLNIDSEDEGVFTVSCAGGNVTKCTVPVSRKDFNEQAFEIKIGGLVGGHSGVEINKGRANANILIGRVLYEIDKACDIRIISVNGGLKDNAIPCEASAVICTENKAKLTEAVSKMQGIFENEYRVTDKNICIEVKPSDYSTPMDKDSTKKILYMLMSVPNGIEAMSGEIENLVQTSLNLGVLKTSRNEVHADFCVRSSKESQKDMLSQRLEALFLSLGGAVEFCGDYPGWDYKGDSPLRELLVKVFFKQYGHEPKIEAIHAGLECGILASKIPGLDCISLGPDLSEVHTYREKMSVSSVGRVFITLTEALKQMK